MIPLILGTLVALAALVFVLYPLLRDAPVTAEIPDGHAEIGARLDAAVAALREIEFDRETGKISGTDYAQLKAKYTRIAVAELRAGGAAACERCAARIEPAAVFCSNCGALLRQPPGSDLQRLEPPESDSHRDQGTEGTE